MTLYFTFRLHAIHGKDWYTIGQLLGRSRLSVSHKFFNLIDQEGMYVCQFWNNRRLKGLHWRGIKLENVLLLKGMCQEI